MSEPQTEDTMIAALLREREGLVQRGLDDRVKQVDEQLRLRGYKQPRRGQQKTPAETAASEKEAAEKAAADKEAADKAAAEQRTEPPKGRRQQPKSES
ncbi:hypothetical protein [Streptomyces sp. NPDC004250]|uniref:hypothetical protein n=1 Tax=Streptomyces sp. NPDC004250 TaxID=3364692 RepID=UPI0036752B91